MYSKFRNMLKMTALGAASAALLVQAGSAFAAPASAGSAASYDIVVLGDSIAAGYQAGFTEQSVPYGFAEHVFEQALFQGLRAEYVNYGVLGLRTEGLANWLEAAIAGEKVTEADVQAGLSDKDPRAKQMLAEMTDTLAGDIRDAETVLISIGGNDFLGFVNELGLTTNVDALSAGDKTALQDKLDALINNYTTQLDDILGMIGELQPKAEVVIANQYLPLPVLKLPNGETTYPKVAKSAALFLKDGQSNLNARLGEVVKAHGNKGLSIKISDAAAVIEKSILTLTSISDGDIHPKAAGYAALGKAYSEQLWGEYKTVLPRAAGVPISVVVNGEEIVSKYAPVIQKGRTYLAVRDITDAMGAELKWDAATATATVSLDGRTVDITVGAATIRVNGETVPLNAEPAYLQQFPGEKKTYLPLAALSEGLGFQVEYRHEQKIAFINK
ncbi:copper amine oxidase domain-containing protein [Paenibacillus agaridevorans]|uniref:Copper amine oxidase domain-containing protein n=1 Tax=Paenibacillus agaridevorans TaxID=171404 RepID=A0A2R5F2A3_9BACL|nr:stalk domain-containing protein [Paenibacillus agaridevorans]GBG09904.1 copper amine oxidase domain-containing protein [Paenibacillus agaridevorans]